MKEFRISEKDYLSTIRLHLGWRGGRLFFYVWLAYTALVMLVPIYRPKPGAWGFVIICSALSGLVFFLIVRFRTWQVRKNYAEQKSLHGPVTVTSTDEGLEWRIESGSFRMKWEDIYKVKENEETFVVYESRFTIRPVPKAAFESEEELAAFGENLKRAWHR